MDIFKKYNQNTWVKNVGYPCIVIFNPENYETIYAGRNPKEYFNEFDIRYFQNCEVKIYFSSSTWTELGTIESLKGMLPEFKIELVMNEVE
jgi:hypothetical protein